MCNFADCFEAGELSDTYSTIINEHFSESGSQVTALLHPPMLVEVQIIFLTFIIIYVS